MSSEVEMHGFDELFSQFFHRRPDKALYRRDKHRRVQHLLWGVEEENLFCSYNIARSIVFSFLLWFQVYLYVLNTILCEELLIIHLVKFVCLLVPNIDVLILIHLFYRFRFFSLINFTCEFYRRVQLLKRLAPHNRYPPPFSLRLVPIFSSVHFFS